MGKAEGGSRSRKFHLYVKNLAEPHVFSCISEKVFFISSSERRDARHCAKERPFRPEAEQPFFHAMFSLRAQCLSAFHHPPHLHAAECFRRLLGRSG